MASLTTFITVVLALSVAAERVVEVIKGLLPTSWLFQANPVPASEARRCAAMHVLAGICGGAAALCSKVDLLTLLHNPSAASTALPSPLTPPHAIASFLIASLLTSAGSAFWNHALDILQATKVQKEQGAIAAVDANH